MLTTPQSVSYDLIDYFINEEWIEVPIYLLCQPLWDTDKTFWDCLSKNTPKLPSCQQRYFTDMQPFFNRILCHDWWLYIRVLKWTEQSPIFNLFYYSFLQLGIVFYLFKRCKRPEDNRPGNDIDWLSSGQVNERLGVITSKIDRSCDLPP